MSYVLEGFKPENLWRYFYELEQIPRESHNEEGVRNWLVQFAEDHDLRYVVEPVGNVIIYKGATKGYEKYPAVALQGHMDMVCVKRPGSKHNFLTDPIELVVDGDILHAKDTTLGGDNGIAVAMMLDILTDENVKHGDLECIFTVNEETGLTGAYGIVAEDLKARMLINLDSEEEGIIYIGCAGGIDTDALLTVDFESIPAGYKAYELDVTGLLGGHSGGEIHKQRANSIKLASRFLNFVDDAMLISAVGGTKRNVIPSTATFTFAAKNDFTETFDKFVKDVKGEYAVQDPDIQITVKEIEVPDKAMSRKQTEAFMRALHLAPHGVNSMSMTLEGVVESSSNLAIIEYDGKAYKIISSHRSSVHSSKLDSARRCADAFLTCGAEVTMHGDYPSWTPDPTSKLAAFCKEAYTDYTGKAPVLTAIHAGLECGIINSIVDGMDSVSMGPDLKAVHSVDECLSISSTERMSGFVKHLLSIIK